MAGNSRDDGQLSVHCETKQADMCSRIRKHADRVAILVICFWINVQSASSISCLGVLLVEFMEYYRVSRAAVTWVAGAHMGGSIIVGPITGLMLKKFSCRTVGVVSALLSSSGLVLAAFLNNLNSLYVTFGLMAGVGPCAYYAIANSSIQHYFTRHRSLACALVLTAFSIGGFVWPPFCRWLIELYSWQGALLIIGALHIQMLVPFMLLGILENSTRQLKNPKLNTNSPPADETVDKVHEKQSLCATENQDRMEVPNGTGVVSNEVVDDAHSEGKPRTFNHCLSLWLCHTVMYCGGVCFGMVLHGGVLVYSPVRSWQMGISKDRGALLVSIVSAAGGFCRIPAGLIGDVKHINRGFLLASSILLCGILSFLSQFIQSFVLLAIFSAVYGCIIAIYLALQTVVLSDIAGMEHLPVAMGILLAGHGLSNILLHPIAGALMDFTGSANTVFITVGIVGICGGILVSIANTLSIFSKRKKQRNNTYLNGGEVEEGVPLHQVPDKGAPTHTTKS